MSAASSRASSRRSRALGEERVATLQHERYRAHRAVRELLEVLAATRPLVLVLDDLHWADSASVELVGTLLRRPPGAAVLIAMAVRRRQVPERLERGARAGAPRGALARMRARRPRRRPSRASSSGGELADGEVAALYEESGGNPFYLEQLARARGRAPAPCAAAARELRWPTSGSARGGRRADRGARAAAPDARRVLEGAAVAGDPFEPELAAAASSTSDASTLDALDELLRADLVRPTDVPRRFRFRHPLVRRAVYESTPGAWRLGAHERSADALAARGASATARAHHVEQSARAGDSGAVALLREAGEAVARARPRAPRAGSPARCA